jgi:hypothetical protein
MLAAWMALETRSFSLVDPLDFIVTVNKGIENLLDGFLVRKILNRRLVALARQFGHGHLFSFSSCKIEYRHLGQELVTRVMDRMKVPGIARLCF